MSEELTFTQEAPDELQLIIREVASIDPKSLVREELGPLNFSEGLNQFDSLIGFFRLLSKYRFDYLPREKRDVLIGIATGALNRIRNIRKFTAEGADASQKREQLLENISDPFLDDTYNHFSPHLLVDISKLTPEIEGTMQELRNKLNDAKEFESQGRQIVADMESALKSVRDAAAEAGVSQQAIYFKNQATKHLQASIAWLVLTFAFGVGTLLSVFYWLEPQLSEVIQDLSQNAPAGEVSIVNLIPIIGSRVIILFVFSFGLVWSARQFSANQHNLVVNRHRQNSLSTFQEFVEATKDDRETRNAVLIQATQSIFAPQPTGFSKRDTEVRSGSQVFEIFRNLRREE